MPPPLANKINTKDNKANKYTKNKEGNKTVHALLAPKKDQQIANQGNPPPKRDKRTFSDVSEESLEGIDLMSMYSDLKDIKKSLQNTVKKSDLDNLVKQKDLKDLVTTIVSKLLSTLKESITEKFNTKLRERTGKLKDEIDALNIDNENFKERLRTKDRQIEELQEKVADCNHRSIDALKSANYNEQYSRKHNIRMVNFPEKRNENLRDVFVKMVKKDLNVEIEPSDVIAIHRIPGKEGNIKPVIAKVRNTEIKIKIMRNKKGLKNDIKFHDDITQRNLGLLARLNTNVMLNNAWFYNCSVYGKLKDKTHSNEDIEKLWQDEWGNTCIFSHCNNKSAGVSVMFNKGLDFKIHDSKIDQKGRFIVLDLSLYEQRLTFVTVYGFNTDEPSLFSDILHNISCYTNTSILMCGDWNVVQDFHMDTYNILHNRNLNSRNKIEEISQTFELLDPWRTCHPR
ncbi:Hypothetical predicted protein [Mytilus galloprovincialis]|uniref:Endonuclease/exonuclease/phosphatase domain-containing protein n=1 Tax=Mytilus galloprovincialis TaxID=29158 RepID=A0A8B6EAK5_MYTGA|nr:Hypothetical predicted protein [Mytilus galloprovincialis]